MVTLTDIFGFLLAHPVALIGVAVLVLALVISLIKKIIKAAIIIILVIVLAGGALYHFAGKEVQERGERLLEDVREQIDNE